MSLYLLLFIVRQKNDCIWREEPVVDLCHLVAADMIVPRETNRKGKIQQETQGFGLMVQKWFPLLQRNNKPKEQKRKYQLASASLANKHKNAAIQSCI